MLWLLCTAAHSAREILAAQRAYDRWRAAQSVQQPLKLAIVHGILRGPVEERLYLEAPLGPLSTTLGNHKVSHVTATSPESAEALLVCCGAIWSRAADPEKQIRVLFIGNSYTSTNDLPQMIAQLAKAGRQPAFKYALLTPGGTTLQQHWEGREAKALIRSQPWDSVVLQEQSTMPLSNPERTVEYARRLHAEIKPTGAKTVLYLTWARQAKPETQTQLNNVYRKASQETGSGAPVGMAWAAALKDDPKLVLQRQ